MDREWVERQKQVRVINLLLLCAFLLPILMAIQISYADATMFSWIRSIGLASGAKSSVDPSADGMPVPCRGESAPSPLAQQVLIQDAYGGVFPLASVRAKCYVVCFLPPDAADPQNVLRCLRSIQQETSDDGIAVLPVLSVADWPNLAGGSKIVSHTLTPFFDTTGAAQRRLKIRAWPTLLVFDAGWNILYDGRGAQGRVAWDGLLRRVESGWDVASDGSGTRSLVPWRALQRAVRAIMSADH
jgi:hypothetical protein